MNSPDFLEIEEVLEIHKDQLTQYGGASGLRDRGLLESAVHAPMAGFGGKYLHIDLFEMAAAYLFHLVKNHPFVDANKRVGLASALVFLDINGISVSAREPALSNLVLDAATGKVTKPDIARFFREHSVKRASRKSP